jgi:hypothetical protein
LGVLSAAIKVYDCFEADQFMHERNFPWSWDFPLQPCVYVGWDNTPRRGRAAIVIVNNSPELFRQRLEAAVASVATRPPEEQLVFVNAWNEWAEGNYLEPDVTHGHRFLEVLRQVTRPSLVCREDRAPA